MRRITLILFTLVLSAGCASNAQPPNAPDYAPDFSLVDFSGNEVRLIDFIGKNNVVLVVYANSTWPPCMQQLGELQKRITEIENFDSEVIAIASKGAQFDVESTKRVLKITFTLISLPNRHVVEDSGIKYNHSNAAFGTVIIDKKGRIRYKSLDEYNFRTSASAIIRELQGI